jgi:hypothetical protein
MISFKAFICIVGLTIGLIGGGLVASFSCVLFYFLNGHGPYKFIFMFWMVSFGILGAYIALNKLKG